MGDNNQDGAIIALQAQLDAVADAIGADRMRAADGYHGTAVLALLDEVERLRKESDDLSRYHLEEFARYKQARNEQHERYDVLHAQFAAAQATLAQKCVEHVELNGHIDLVEQCRDWLAMREDDAGGRIQEFVDSLGIVIAQLDRQRRRANWYEAAHEAGKEKLIESRLAKAIAPAREAAHALANAVTALGLAAPDTPEVLATADPIADAEFKLWKALGIDEEHPAVTESRRATLNTKGPTSAD